MFSKDGDRSLTAYPPEEGAEYWSVEVVGFETEDNPSGTHKTIDIKNDDGWARLSDEL